MKKALLLGLCLCLALAGCGARVTQTPPAVPPPTVAPGLAPTAGPGIPWAPWPTQDWARAAPEQVGMDSTRLLTLLDLLAHQNLNLHSLLVIRRGYLVLEVYAYPYQAGSVQDMQSCTKSVTALLAGIALQNGRLQSIDQKVLDFFPDYTPKNLDAFKQAMTVRHLLTMTSGFNWPEATQSYASSTNPVRAMWNSADPLRYVLDTPMAAQPGTLFNYNTGASQLLAAIIERASGQKLSEFAKANLFDPLGIQNFTWHKMRGLEAGGAGLALTPRSMAKLGYLALRGGQWEDRPVVPAAWVAEATHRQVEAPQHGAYGYQWWVDPTGGSFSAAGFGGQSIQVYPRQDLVVVVSGAMNPAQHTTLRNLVQYFVLPAVTADHRLPAAAAAEELRAAALAPGQRPAASPPAAPPALAGQISGRRYTLAANPLNWKHVSLEFGAAEAYLTVGYKNGTSSRLPLGLDGVPRLNDTPPTILSGSWDNEHTFSLRYEVLGDADGRTLRFTFAGSSVSITSTSFVQMDVATFSGQAE